MKTIITTLPIYNKIEKQCFERAKHATNKGLFAIVCPRHRLPSFQWLDDADGAASVSTVTLVHHDETTTNITSYFVALPALAHDYFTYSGATLKYLLPTGNHYLKITMNNGYIYYSEWFTVDCVYANLVETFSNTSYGTFTFAGGAITSAIQGGGDPNGSAGSEAVGFPMIKGETIKVIFYLTKNSGQLPTVSIRDKMRVNPEDTIDTAATVEGLNEIELTSTGNLDILVFFANTAVANWLTSEVIVIRNYSTKYLIIDFHNDCDLGDFYYHGGFTQSLWFESEPMETTFPMEEDGMKNGEARFVRSFARQEKKYIARTKEMPDYMVEVFNRMKLHDFVQLTDLFGDQHYVYNLEPEHEWLGEDKYYARINLTFDFDEAVVIAGCCNDII